MSVESRRLVEAAFLNGLRPQATCVRGSRLGVTKGGLGVEMGGQFVSFASFKLEQAPTVARSAEAIGGVVVYGLKELQDAKTCVGDFVEAWRDAICSEIGSEEFEKSCLERRRKISCRYCAYGN